MDGWSRGDGGYLLKRRHSENWINDEIRNGSRIPVRNRRGSWEQVKPTTSSSRRGGGGLEGDRNALSDSERRRSNGEIYRRYSSEQSAGGWRRDRSRGRKNLSDSENGGFRIRRRGSYDPTSLRNKKAVQGAMRSRSMGRNYKRRYESDGSEGWSREGLNTSSSNRRTNYGRYGIPERLRGGRSEDDARWFSDRRSYLGLSRGGRGREPLVVSGRGDTSLGTGPGDAGETDYDAVLLLSYQQALER